MIINTKNITINTSQEEHQICMKIDFYYVYMRYMEDNNICDEINTKYYKENQLLLQDPTCFYQIQLRIGEESIVQSSSVIPSLQSETTTSRWHVLDVPNLL